MLKDLIHAARMLRQSKGWTIVVLLSLALGIGANTALFTAVNGVLLQTVTVPDPGSLVRLKWAGENDMVRGTSEYGSNQPYNGKRVTATFSYPGYLELRKANKTLTDIAALNPNNRLNVVINGDADLANVATVTGNYFTMLRATPLTGRLLQEDDDRPGAPLVGVVSHAFWRKRFAADPATTIPVPCIVTTSLYELPVITPPSGRASCVRIRTARKPEIAKKSPAVPM